MMRSADRGEVDVDARVYRSKVRIAEALFEKLAVYELDEISVSEVVAKAGVSRNTYYRHFSTKRSVLTFYIEELLREYLQGVEERGISDVEGILNYYFSFWGDRKEYVVLLRRRQLLDLALDVQRKKFLEALPRSDLPWHGVAGVDETLVDLLFVGGMWNILLHWLDRGMDPKASEVVRTFLEELSVYAECLP
jgi:putative transcriptional regulator